MNRYSLCAMCFFFSAFLTSIPGVLISNFGLPITAWMIICLCGLLVAAWAPCCIFGHAPVPQPSGLGGVLTFTLYGDAHCIQLCSRCHAVYWERPPTEKTIAHKHAHSKHEG